MTLTNREFSALVDKGLYPEQVEVPLDPPFSNENGQILNLLMEKFTSVALLYSKEGAVRANHYHKTDWHYTYVQSGVVWYYWRSLGSEEAPQCQAFPQGSMFFTPPLVEHAMFFPEESTILTFAKNIRDTEHHEEDVVRVPLLAVRRVGLGWQITFGSP